jgi:hypothetical protein
MRNIKSYTKRKFGSFHEKNIAENQTVEHQKEFSVFDCN